MVRDSARIAAGCIVLGLVLLPVRGVAQQDTRTGVTGVVVQARDGSPVFEAAVRLMHTDGSGVILSGRTGEDGRYLLIFPADRETIPDSALVEAGALGAGIRISAPFRLERGRITEAPPLELQTEAIALDTIGVEVDRPWWYIAPPRERVLDRQLRGKGVFLPGATISAAEERDLAWVLANRVEGLRAVPARGARSRLESLEGNRCMVALVNEWPVSSTLSLESIPRNDIASVEIYREWDEVPEELRFHVYTREWPPCGLINVWLWDSWNRGIEGPR